MAKPTGKRGYGCRFAAHERKSEKEMELRRNTTAEERKEILTKRKIRANRKCVDCGTLISYDKRIERCFPCSRGKIMKGVGK